MTKTHNVFDVPLSKADGSPVREFRVSRLSRYQVTDWTDYRGGAGTRVVAEGLTLDQANAIATEFGRAQPGSLVNLMEDGEGVDYGRPEPLPAPNPKVFSQTIWELSWGGGNTPNQTRYFSTGREPDAIVRMSEEVVRLDRDASISAAWVHFKRLPDSIFPDGQLLAAWTKTSDERPTHEGALTPEEACR